MAYRTGILFTDGSGSQDVVSLKTQASDVILADSSNLEDSLMARFKSEGVAAPFRETKTYAVGTYVTHEGFLYRCKKIITESGAWTGSENWTKVLVTDLGGGEGGGSVEEIDDTAAITSTEKVWSIGKINTVLNGNIAPTFSTSTAYSVGDFVLYNGALYKFTSAHSAGAWNASHVAAAKVTSDLSTSGSDIDDTAAINSTTPAAHFRMEISALPYHELAGDGTNGGSAFNQGQVWYAGSGGSGGAGVVVRDGSTSVEGSNGGSAGGGNGGTGATTLSGLGIGTNGTPNTGGGGGAGGCFGYSYINSSLSARYRGGCGYAAGGNGGSGVVIIKWNDDGQPT